MSIFDDIAGIAGDVIGGISTSNAAGDEKDALKKEIKFLKESRDLANQRADEARDKALAIYQPFAAQAQPAINYQRGVMAQPPGQMTGSQQIGLEDLIRTGKNNLAAGGLLGAGRAGQSVLMDAIRRYTAGAIDTNTGRSDVAASNLGNMGYNAGVGQANANIGAANTVGQNTMSAADKLAGVTGQIGDVNAAKTQAFGSLGGDALAGIAGLISRAAGRPEQYLPSTGSI